MKIIVNDKWGTWVADATPVQESYRAYYEPKGDFDPSEILDMYSMRDWFMNNMNWEDLDWSLVEMVSFPEYPDIENGKVEFE